MQIPGLKEWTRTTAPDIKGRGTTVRRLLTFHRRETEWLQS